MPEPFPSHFLSIPRSLTSLKHYFRIHDQPFSRSLVYLLLLSLVITLLSIVVAVVGYLRDATAQSKALAEKLADVRFEEGKARSDLAQPAVLWKGRGMLVVLDTTGKVETTEQAMEFAGCAQSARVLFFGGESIESFERPTAKNEKGQNETYAYTDAAKLAELRKLVEAHGGKLPDVKLVDGVARFSLPPGQLVIPVHSAALMVLVDTSGKKRPLRDALSEATEQDPALIERFVPPEFLVLMSGAGVSLKPRFAQAETSWEFAKAAALSPASVAARIAGMARQARLDATFRWFLHMLVLTVMLLFVLALILSVAGLLASGLLRAGLSFVELLSIAIYAGTPSAVAFLLAMAALQGRGGQWVLAVPFVVGMAYTTLGARCTARELGTATAPKL